MLMACSTHGEYTHVDGMQVLEHKERLAAISGEATQEAALEALLAQVADK
jgi:hypothetical protein